LVAELQADPERPVAAWFAGRGWQPFGFQREVWQAWQAGESGLLHAPTGSGKTLAVFIGALLAAQARAAQTPQRARRGLRILWLTPMRSLAADTARALAEALAGLGLDWRVGVRTGDTPSAERARQDRALPEVLVTTPESLTLMFTHAARLEGLGDLVGVIVDEWHELLGSKRGVQVELALAHLRTHAHGPCIWGMSATLGNLVEARNVLLGGDSGRLVQGRQDKTLQVESLLPAQMDRFPWAGHLGLVLIDQVIERIAAVPGTLVFTNTRSQSELWYQALLARRPDWAGEIALHHGSIDREVRSWVEAGLRSGALRCVVCTSSLDLGVDFAPVAQVLQIGSPKGVARLAQRAGRSGHAPGQISRVLCVPTHAFELLESAAAREALQQRRIESRPPLHKPLDVLIQHLVTLAAGAGFRPQVLLAEVRGTCAYASLETHEWQWVLDFVRHGGAALQAYPEYRKVQEQDGVWRVTETAIARRHRMAVGTIVSDGSVDVRFLRGARLGSVEEAFVARLRKGDCFSFAGRTVELVRVEGMTALVRAAGARRAVVPRWWGGKMPLSSELAAGVRALLDRAVRAGSARHSAVTESPADPELQALAPILALQARWSAVPTSDALLVERLQTREGHHLFVFPFEGRQVHGALAALLAWRISRAVPMSFSMAWNDYGFELLSAQSVDLDGPALRDLLHCPEQAALGAELLASLNAAEMTRRHFREIARVAGLVFQGYPGAAKSVRQVQVSSSLLHDVFARFDPGNLLLRQAEQEVLRRDLELPRLHAFLLALPGRSLLWQTPPRVTPFAFPLLVERMRERLSSETLAERVGKMQYRLEQAAGEP
jgi:ATP-dependent Lhr-like helicase